MNTDTRTHITLIADYSNETFRWHSLTTGYFGPEFSSEHDARLWYSAYINSV